MEAAHWEAIDDGQVRCKLCPHGCLLSPGASGLCKVRKNEKGRLVLPFFGLISALSLDPMEKKPLYHFLPGTEIFSVGFFGCNLRCPFCQNWEISQKIDPAARRVSPEALVRAALESCAPSIAFTYSEPLVHFEFILEAARLAKEAGLFTVLVTNGTLNEAPVRELLPLIDAANIDLKSWSAETYERTLGGDLEAVKRFIALAAGLCRVEVTTLVVPGVSEGEEAVEDIAAFLAGLDAAIPLHLSAYHPAYAYAEKATSPSRLLSLAELAAKRLKYVYTGNIAPASGSGRRFEDTACGSCGAILVSRRGYSVELSGLAAGDRADGDSAAPGGPPDRRGGLRLARCAACGSPSPIVVKAQ